MRVSKPGQKRVERRNSESKRQSTVKDDKIQPSHRAPHNPNYDMQYGCSRASGCKAGGHYWNPPDYCESRIFAYGGEAWVHVGLCHGCFRYKAKTCPAAAIKKTVYVNGKPMFDEPSNRKPKRVERHVAARQLREQVKPRRVSTPQEPPRRRRVS